MSNIHIERKHHFSFKKARQIAFRVWALLRGQSAGGLGEVDIEPLGVQAQAFCGQPGLSAGVGQLDAQLGFLLGAFKGSIETEIVKRLDDLLADKGRARSGRKS